MITGDQPTCFSHRIVAHVSSRSNGSMLDRTLGSRHETSIVANRRRFCREVGVEYDSCVYQIIEYGSNLTYDIIREVKQPNTQGVAADVLYTTSTNIGLFLPIADCVGTIIYDPRRHAVALAHLGRHATVARTMQKALEFFRVRGSDMQDIVVWMAPSVSESDYVMEYFDQIDEPDWRQYAKREPDGVHLDLSGYNAMLASYMGVRKESIHLPTTNTARSPHYFSHSQGDTSARFAVVVMMH